MSLKSTVEFYKQSKYLYKSISDVFDQFESNQVSEIQKDTIISRTLDDIDRLNSLLNKINIRELEGNYPKSEIDKVEHNIDFYYEAADYIEKYLLAKKYYESLLNGVRTYIRKMALPEYEYKRYAGTENELSKKFTAMLLHPNHISQFINQIKRMAVGTMSFNEFKKIFVTNKGKMPKYKSQTFQSFSDYKDDTNKSKPIQYKP